MSAMPSKWIALFAAAGSLAVAGCGSTNPPCPTVVSEVDAARRAADAVEERLETGYVEKERLEEKIADEKARREDLERRKAEIETEIAELEG